MKYSDIINQVSKELDIPINIVDKTYKAYWKFIRNTIHELPLKDSLNEQEFNQLKTNFNIPSIGKLSCTYNRLIGCNKRMEYLKDKFK